uniref:SplA/ryanodine receptor domain and SOCS box containing 1 n=1 Tax=Rhabditophanes sp. KR3021 TaxID=114890 RepID=A0AC35U6J0_9BILA
MGQRASMEEQDESRGRYDADSQLEQAADRFLNGYFDNRQLTQHRFTQMRNSLMEFARASPTYRGPMTRSRAAKLNKVLRSHSPAYPACHEVLYHDDLTCPCRFDTLLSQPPPDKKTMEEHSWNPLDRSLNIFVKDDDPLTLHRHPVAQSTDCIRGKVAYSRGFHVWQIIWPLRQRGTHAVVGVATTAARLHSIGYTSLIGSTTESYGWDLVRLRASHDGKHSDSWTFPNMAQDENGDEKFLVPESFYCILDMDEGYMAFATDTKYLGVAFRGLKGKALHPIVSAVWGHCEITMKYLGGLDPEPPTLLANCRRAIRQHLGRDNINRIEMLNLPPLLRNYLLFK